VALATAYPVAACGSHAHNNAGHAPAGSHSTHAGELFLDPGQDGKPLVPTGTASAGPGAEVVVGARLGWRPGRRRLDLTHLADGCRTTQTPEERLT
jgi:hypothetical protein